MTQNHEVEEFERELVAAMGQLGLTDRTVGVAISGGGDSVALLLGLSATQVCRPIAFHVDHQLREDSAADSAWVTDFASRLGVPHYVKRIDVGPGAGLEARARALRYAALEVMREEAQAEVLVTGHTASDQAETLLFRLGRGSSLEGARGVLPVRGLVKRPLLWATRARCRQYLELKGQACLQDPMNDELAFSRVRVRKEVLPALTTVTGPHTELALARFAALAGEDDELLAQLATAAFTRVALEDELDRAGLLSLERPIARRVVTRWLRAASVEVSAEHVEGVLAAAAAQRGCPLPGDQVMTCMNGRLSIRPGPARRLQGTSR